MLFVDYVRADDAIRQSPYHTDNCMAVLQPPAIIVNAAFMLELEAAFRSFDLSEELVESQYLRSDHDLFGLVRRISSDPQRWLAKLRRLGEHERKRDRSYIVETVTMVALFFICHELGHLLAGVSERQYGAFVRADAGLEQSVTNAVVKLCRHVDEFAHYKFNLPGFDQAEQRDSEIRRREQELGAEIEDVKTTNEKWFRDEIAADEKATELLIAYVANAARKDAFLGDQLRYVTVKGLFSAALYTWSRDLLAFGEKMNMDGAPSARALVGEMMQSRETYVHAATLFGDIHRFTLLRAALTAEAVIRSGSDFFDRKDDQKSIWWSREETRKTGDRRKWWERLFVWRPAEANEEDRRVLRQWWLAESLQRYYLLCIHMDTAVKIAYMGCSAGWMLELDRQRGAPQLFVMTFEPIDEAVKHLRRFR